MDKNKKTNDGFFAIEGILILIIVIGIGGACVWAFINHSKTSNNNSNNSNADNTQLTAPVGTTDRIDQLIQQDSQDESSINTKYDSDDQSAATSTNTSQTNLGGVYDESSF